jgi:uncharacterized protein YjbI with pentapeptide repeats
MSYEKKEISSQELDRILFEHRKWIISDGKEGRRADLSNVFLDPQKINNLLINLPKGILSNAIIYSFPPGSDNVHRYEYDIEEGNICPAHFEGAELWEADFEEAWLWNAHFEGADLQKANFKGASLGGGHFQGANLWNANFEGADVQFSNFEGANLEHANFAEARAKNTNFQGADLYRVNFEGADIHNANFEGVHLTDANFARADVHGTQLKGAHLLSANFEGASLRRADLRGAYLENANLENANVKAVKFDRKGKYRGIRVDSCFGSARFKRHAQDEDWLEEFLETRETTWQIVWAWFWKISSDYGRSFYRWGMASFLIALFFAYAFTKWPDWVWCGPIGRYLNFAYSWMPEQYWNTLADICPQFNQPLDFFSALYFSIVTFTTLGFGDIHATNLSAKFLVTIEVIIGYIMLGGLISILANKLARRS